MVTSVLGSGVEGLSRSREGLNQSAKTIANGGQSPSGESLLASSSSSDDKMLSAVVDLTLYEVQFKASAKVIATADETLGHLIDETV
ncbi:flagellar biosynthesis protein FlgE [Litoribrevibacter albus]|uniref:Flagellar basal-body/hook protein C-terminal domain-containing protein n=1 Tax=Litoribrevibacter albus TaxID=1473156 RepID=A0AA37SDR9_9GAMM|nr:flagellar biosynthesis protein FlgE [Litoribrevibacter albus]GLQ33278.1 hypothetical protein GCM10007876_37580 [Litoribrevibacter albus]